ncbi:MAG TPA: metallophosphatase [Chitinophagaceae bacterium]|jgi:predicted MPP superfamily phosphohydrolase|nr:metallophosphatase [Chitinophagaceae bacterium]HAN38154.1 metallophosphatase [Chitinophagaceae bacterium]
MRNTFSFFIVAALMLTLDLYVFQAVKSVTATLHERTRFWIHNGYWTISIVAIILIAAFPFIQVLNTNKFIRNYFIAILFGLFIAKLIAGIVFLVDDLRRGATWAALRLSNSVSSTPWESVTISRSQFLNWLGLGLGSTLFGVLLWGFRNKYRYHVNPVKLDYSNLPQGFHGLKVVHISDIHSGSFQNPKAVAHGIDLIMQQKPDLILFTGDLVNDRADEMNEYKAIFSKLQAPLGVYSTLGNHDYGDYVQWPTPEAKAANLAKLKATHAEMGWRLLMNEHVVLERNGDKIALLGIENWGAKGRFPKYGKMNEAYPGTEDIPFKILMSHDPSHWDAQVLTQYPDINLTLSGHTHGMQFGLENPYFKWSPVQWMYKQWAGLYEATPSQKLYVNRGFGFIGYPGRVGILPEITVLEFAKQA